MTTHQSTLGGHGGLSPEEMEALIRRAHQERTQAVREALAWLLNRHRPTTPASIAGQREAA